MMYNIRSMVHPETGEHNILTVQRGVKIVNPPADYPYGEKQYTALDLAGHRLTFSETVTDVDPAEWDGLAIKNNE